MTKPEFRGAWIFPDGEIYHTDNIDSHITVIQNELHLQDELVKYSETIAWTKEQKERYLDLDFVYLAMRKGYVRATSFLDQFAIQGVAFPLEQKQIDAIFKVHEEMKTIFKTYILEVYDGENFLFDSIYDILDECSKLHVS